MYNDILYGNLEIPDYLSKECQDLLSKLLTRDPNHRLGHGLGFEEIKNHPWCAKINWEYVLHKRMAPPFKPSLYTSNIDPECRAEIQDEKNIADDSIFISNFLNSSSRIIPDIYYEAP